MEQAGFYRKYVILNEKDPGFGFQRPPEGFARLDGNKEGLTLSLQVKNLREGTEPYTVILIYDRNGELGVIRAGSLEVASRNGFFSRRLDNEAIRAIHMQPENIRYVVVAAEHRERVFIPIAGICNKSYPWDESVRQRIAGKQNSRPEAPDKKQVPGTVPQTRSQEWSDPLTGPTRDEYLGQGINPTARAITNPGREASIPPNPDLPDNEMRGGARPNLEWQQAAPEPGPEQSVVSPAQKTEQPSQQVLETNPEASEEKIDASYLADIFNKLLSKLSEKKTDADPRSEMDEEPANAPEEEPDQSEYKIDDIRLERKLKDNFESFEPFFNPRHDYSWYRVNDLARLSNLLFACNMRIPLFANPKILVGLFKYRHLLAGFYRSERNNMKYFVLGVPSKDDSEGEPFANISRWVESHNPEYGDMTGYWLVYINLKSGEFVR